MRPVKIKLLLSIWTLAALLSLASCLHEGHGITPSHVLVLRYQDFASQAAAYGIIGFEWYQWNSQGPDNPLQHDDVRVVVYRDISLDRAKQMYPVVRGHKDYRYLNYELALLYCDRLLHEYGDSVEHIQRTKRRIHEHFDASKAYQPLRVTAGAAGVLLVSDLTLPPAVPEL